MATTARSGKAAAARFILGVSLVVFLAACATTQPPTDTEMALAPVVITEEVKYDTDDPAIWIHPTDPSQSLIVGTDKNPEDGALYVFDLDGKILPEKTVRPLLRVNNVDIEYGLMLGGEPVDIAVGTERGANKIRVYSLPDMKEIDNGGIDVFTGEEGRRAMPMGISLYRRPSDGTLALQKTIRRHDLRYRRQKKRSIRGISLAVQARGRW
jgi:3-phytase